MDIASRCSSGGPGDGEFCQTLLRDVAVDNEQKNRPSPLFACLVWGSVVGMLGGTLVASITRETDRSSLVGFIGGYGLFGLLAGLPVWLAIVVCRRRRRS